jgi:hypothetical protein
MVTPLPERRQRLMGLQRRDDELLHNAMRYP